MISLDDMAELARLQLDAEADVEAAETALKKAKERARKLREETVPAAMQELGIKKLTLETGQVVSVGQEVYCSIPKATEHQAFDWLEENDFGSLIKTTITLEYGKGDKEKAMEMYTHLMQTGLTPKFKEGVHASSLKAFLKEQISKGAEVPLDLFGAQPVWVAKIK